MEDSQPLGDSQTHSDSDREQPAKFGERVDVLSGGTESPIGTYDCATIEGDLYAGTIVEIQNATSINGVNALSYRLDKSETKGKFPKPTTWSMLSALSFAMLIAVLILDLILGAVDLGTSRWSYILSLALIAILSTLAVGKRMRIFVGLAMTGIELEKIEKLHKKPVLDLPTGRLKEVRDTVNSALSALPQIEKKEA